MCHCRLGLSYQYPVSCTDLDEQANTTFPPETHSNGVSGKTLGHAPAQPFVYDGVRSYEVPEPGWVTRQPFLG